MKSVTYMVPFNVNPETPLKIEVRVLSAFATILADEVEAGASAREIKVILAELTKPFFTEDHSVWVNIGASGEPQIFVNDSCYKGKFGVTARKIDQELIPVHSFYRSNYRTVQETQVSETAVIARYKDGGFICCRKTGEISELTTMASTPWRLLLKDVRDGMFKIEPGTHQWKALNGDIILHGPDGTERKFSLSKASVSSNGMPNIEINSDDDFFWLYSNLVESQAILQSLADMTGRLIIHSQSDTESSVVE